MPACFDGSDEELAIIAPVLRFTLCAMGCNQAVDTSLAEKPGTKESA